MEVDENGYSIEWVPDPNGAPGTDPDGNDDDIIEEEYLVGDEIIPSSEINTIPNSLDQIAAENLIYMAHDGNVAIMGDLIEEQVEQAENADYNGEHQYFECQVQEEVITDDWVQQQGEDRVEVPVDQIGSEACVGGGDDVDDVPLPTDQDEYTTSRPYPCDFCSRRFRKKANLMNHMVAHKNDRPHICNLCGARYIRRVDLLNHLKVHAQVPEQEDDIKPILYSSTAGMESASRQYRKPTAALKAAKQPRAPAKSRRPAASAAAASVVASTVSMMRDLSPPPLHLPAHMMHIAPPIVMKKEYIQQEDMQLLLDVAQQHERQQEQLQKQQLQQQQQQQQLFMQQNDQQLEYEIAEVTERYPVIDPDRPFVCQQCGVSFAREKALLSHSKMHGTDSPHECDSCSEMFWDLTQLRDHQKSHHAGASSNSEYEPPDDADRDKDTDSDADSKFGVFYCSVCGISFHRNELLLRHQKTHVKYDADHQHDVNTTTAHNADGDADDDGRHSCTVCGDSFAEALDLLAHAEIHTRYQPFKCMLCGETFAEEAVIKRHITNVHGAELTSNSCRLCGKLCRDSRTLMKHSWEHSSEKNHSCSKCGKTFHNKARLKRHMQSHRNKSVTCDVCSEEFPDGRSLMNHRHSHTNVSGRQFPCKECGKTFGSRSSQQIHMRIHTGERPYGCRFCWKAFADGGTLRKHERIHTGEKPYACPICPRAFNQRVVLREHIRSHHSGPDSKNGSSATPFYCTVCGDSFGTSILLIQHLIEHSDMNTALKRQPPTGPRKYKRRRKLKPHELEHRARAEQKPASDYTDDDDDDLIRAAAHASANADDADEFDDYTAVATSTAAPRTSSRRTLVDPDRRREKKTSFSSAALDDNYLNNVENTLQNIDSLVIPSASSSKRQSAAAQPAPPTTAPSPPTKPAAKRRAAAAKPKDPLRPKMIHTQKTRVPADDNGKRKSKTLITRTTPQGKELPAQPSVAATAASTRSRRSAAAAQKQQQQQPTTTAIKFEPYTGGDDAPPAPSHHDFLSQPLSETEILLKLSRNNPKYNPDVFNDLEDILRSPVKVARTPATAGGSSLRFTTTAISPVRDFYLSPARLRLEESGGDDTESGTETEQQQQRLAATSSSNTADQYPHEQQSGSEDENDQQQQLHHHQPDDDGGHDQSSSDQDDYEEDHLGIHIKNEPVDDEYILGAISSVGNGARSGYTCEMCAAVFKDRAQLLLHVPIHI